MLLSSEIDTGLFSFSLFLFSLIKRDFDHLSGKIILQQVELFFGISNLYLSPQLTKYIDPAHFSSDLSMIRHYRQ